MPTNQSDKPAGKMSVDEIRTRRQTGLDKGLGREISEPKTYIVVETPTYDRMLETCGFAPKPDITIEPKQNSKSTIRGPYQEPHMACLED